MPTQSNPRPLRSPSLGRPVSGLLIATLAFSVTLGLLAAPASAGIADLDLRGTTGRALPPGTPIAGDPAGGPTPRGSQDLVLTASPVKVPLGGKTELEIELAAFDGTNLDVDLYRRTHGGSEQFLRTIALGAQGRGAATVKDLKYDTRFRAAWTGDGTYGPAEDIANVRVKAKVTGKLLRFQRKQGRTRLYKQGKPVFYVAKVAPNHANDPASIRLQARVNGRWRNLDVFKGRLNADSLIGVKLGRTGRAPTGVPFRFRCEFGGGHGNLPDNSPWANFRFFS